MLISLLFLTSWIFTQYHPQEWGSVTSLLTPTGIQISTDGTVYASTSGGLLKFNPVTEEFDFIKTEEGLIYLDLSTISIDTQDRLWLGGAYPKGYLQVYEPDQGLVREITHLNDVSEIKMIEIGSQKAYAVYVGTSSDATGILEFDLDDSGLPDYRDYYTNFSTTTVTEIRDFDYYQDSLLYITTDQGIFVGRQGDNLKFIESWHPVYEENNGIQFIPQAPSLVVLDSTFLYQQGDDWSAGCVTGITGEALQAERKDDALHILTKEYYYEIVDCISDSFHIPVGNQNIIKNVFGYEFGTFFTSFDMVQNEIYFGMEFHGILHFNNTVDYEIFTPNTAFSNEFRALTLTQSGNIAATSLLGTIFIDSKVINLIPKNYYSYYSGTSENFHVTSLDYSPGEHAPISIIEKNNGNLIFCNSGVGKNGGAVIELDYKSGNLDIKKYDNTAGVIDGFWWIYPPHVNSEYMVVNQMEKDKSGNIWVVNPYCERYGHLLAIQSAGDDSWSHINIPDSSSFRPQDIAFDRSNRVWVGFAYDGQNLYGDDAANPRIYSSGGIKIYDLNQSDWILLDNTVDLPGSDSEASVWSLVIDNMDFLWIMNEKGVRTYTYSLQNNNLMLLNPLYKDIYDVALDYLPQMSYVKGNRIKVDSQNNKWIITHQGVWVIQESMLFWPSKEGLHPDNSGLLSDVVYDVAFNNDKGLAYIATDKGISILHIPFAKNPGSAESMYISPNPFIVPDDEFVFIKNISSGSIIKIMTITGTLIKEIQLPPNQSQTTWDGTNEQGHRVGTAVYLVAAHHPSERNKVSKIAVIHK